MNKSTFGLQRGGGEDRVGGVGRSLRSLRMVAVAVLLAGTVALGLFASVASAAPTAHAQGSWGWLYYKQGYYLDNGWMCYGWSNGAYHCTQHWHWSNGHLVSDNVKWVPNYGSSASSASSNSSSSSPTSQSSGGQLVYKQGYYLDNGWMCYGWSSGAYHCTRSWHWSNGHMISDNTAWVPNYGSSSGSSSSHNSGGTPSSSPPSNGSVTSEIQAVFGPYAGAALAVARCESGYNPSAYNASSGASGVFQFLYSTWLTTNYAGYSRFNAWANINAAHQVFVRDGYSWREWQCQP